MLHNRMKKSGRRSSGSAMTELAPALLFLLLAVFFPLLDLTAMGLTYSAGATLTDLQADKAALLPSSMAQKDDGPVKSGVVSAWKQTGIGTFAHLSEPPITQVTYPLTNGVQYVVVSTSFLANPFLTIPFIPGVPGLSAPMGFRCSSKRVLEDPGDVGK